jgi:DNA polymerase/3'-5' exonuclease PolX
MSTSIKRPLKDAQQDANDFRGLFPGCYERWEIAGSVRRLKADVGDVEHVVIPKGDKLWRRIEELTRDADNMFADPNAPFVKHVYPNGTHRWGERYRGVDFRSFAHEIFVADVENWGAILAIRTGPAEFSEMLVTRLKVGGRLRQQDGFVRYPDNSIYAVKTETQFFNACGVEYCEPSQRKVSV